ncbi:hypothetical protein BU24DRAFT_495432 [Aaosphaeria arxii CBS 175.79]|uniref:Uncharacterized protein n=1 Tax=Aaosphaeria arxii CBS 175.79 TaxID=1450172 RepID=A0A6A5XFQ1_9PLEO|nr:uncharacterized protein BU24DRAFT_495432 [Aaosphaeria arxii CBS 175.79]KAF2011204.1 hypothetical protein BU24DRAFT_495432 [Aaosphaeria arxii CBS 175.79]
MVNRLGELHTPPKYIFILGWLRPSLALLFATCLTPVIVVFAVVTKLYYFIPLLLRWRRRRPDGREIHSQYQVNGEDYDGVVVESDDYNC